MILLDNIKFIADNDPARIAITDMEGQREISFSELWTISCKLASKLKSLNVKKDVCKAVGKTPDLRHITKFLKIPEGVDITKLEFAIERLVSDHPIYFCNASVQDKIIKPGNTNDFKCEHFSMAVSQFKDFRNSLYYKIRDLEKEPLFTAGFVELDNSETYVYLSISHLAYDMVTFELLARELACYYAGEACYKEEITAFDIIDWEQNLKNTQFYDKALEVHDKAFKGFPKLDLFDTIDYNTNYITPLTGDVCIDNIRTFAKDKSISTLTLYQAALELAVQEFFGLEKFCYINTYAARFAPNIRHTQGPVFRYLFSPSSIHESANTHELLKNIELKYQELCYYNVEDCVEMSSKYPQVITGIGLNVREQSGLELRLDGQLLQDCFAGKDIQYTDCPFRPLNVIIDFVEGSPYLGVSGVSITQDQAKDFAELYINKMSHCSSV